MAEEGTDHDFADFVKWLGEGRRTVSAPGTMAAEFHLPREAKELMAAYLIDRHTAAKGSA